jgi:hypothetical protein
VHAALVHHEDGRIFLIDLHSVSYSIFMGEKQFLSKLADVIIIYNVLVDLWNSIG